MSSDGRIVLSEVGADVCKEAIDEEPRNILLGLISQLKLGTDLSKVTFPTFVLEPRSLLERITDFMSHQDIIFQYNPFFNEIIEMYRQVL